MCPQKRRKSCANKWVSGKDGLGEKTSRQPGSGDPVGTRVAAEAESERARSRAAVSLPSRGREGHRPILRTSSLEKSLRPRQAVVPSGPVKAKARGAAGAAPNPGMSRRELAMATYGADVQVPKCTESRARGSRKPALRSHRPRERVSVTLVVWGSLQCQIRRWHSPYLLKEMLFFSSELEE